MGHEPGVTCFRADSSGCALRSLQNHVGGSTCGLATDPTLIFISILGVVPAHILTFLIVWFLVTNRGRRPFWQTLGWNFPENFGPWKTIALAAVLLGVGVLFTQFLGGKETALDQDHQQFFKGTVCDGFSSGRHSAVGGRTDLSRCKLYPALQRAMGMVAAVAVVTVLFAGIHVFQYYDNFGVVAVITMLSLSLTLTSCAHRAPLAFVRTTSRF